MAGAVVLGGGGPVGIGWETGLIAGFARAGVRLDEADLVVGTSAGSVVGAHLRLGDDLEALVRTGAATAGGEAGDPARMARGIEGLMTAALEALAHPGSPEEARRILGRFATGSDTGPEEEYLRLFAALAGRPWPEGYVCTAIDTETGALVVWDGASAVPLDVAVASSCSVPGVFPAVTVNGRRYMDGGMRTALNADLAAGHASVVVISCMALAVPAGVDDPISAKLAAQIDAELAALHASGAQVAVVEPDEAFLELSGYGMHLMDFSRAAAAFDCGAAAAAALSERVGAVWS